MGMKIPHITIKFDALLHETDKAYLFEIRGRQTWLPKKLCSNLNVHTFNMDGSGGKGTVNIAPFKFEEITGIVPQALDSFVISEVRETMESNTISQNYDLIDLPGFKPYRRQMDILTQLKQMRKAFIYGQMRTGKTVLASIIAASRLAAGIIETVIVIAPLRTEAVWRKHCTCDFQFFASEHFSNPHTWGRLNLSCDEKTLVILDESHMIKNEQTLRQDRIISTTELAGHKIS